jgi:hypothetical protein
MQGCKLYVHPPKLENHPLLAVCNCLFNIFGDSFRRIHLVGNLGNYISKSFVKYTGNPCIIELLTLGSCDELGMWLRWTEGMHTNFAVETCWKTSHLEHGNGWEIGWEANETDSGSCRDIKSVQKVRFKSSFRPLRQVGHKTNLTKPKSKQRGKIRLCAEPHMNKLGQIVFYAVTCRRADVM